MKQNNFKDSKINEKDLKDATGGNNLDEFIEVYRDEYESRENEKLHYDDDKDSQYITDSSY